jgi:hypothetical protein
MGSTLVDSQIGESAAVAVARSSWLRTEFDLVEPLVEHIAEPTVRTRRVLHPGINRCTRTAVLKSLLCIGANRFAVNPLEPPAIPGAPSETRRFRAAVRKVRIHLPPAKSRTNLYRLGQRVSETYARFIGRKRCDVSVVVVGSTRLMAQARRL